MKLYGDMDRRLTWIDRRLTETNNLGGVLRVYIQPGPQDEPKLYRELLHDHNQAVYAVDQETADEFIKLIGGGGEN